MEKIPGYDTATPVYGAFQRLPLANYVCTIVNAEETISRKGNRCIKLAFDIAEGEYAGFYSRQYKENKKINGDNAMWPFAGIYYVSAENANRLKGFIYCIERSNKGFSWNWNEKALKGMKFAGCFVEESRITADGKTLCDTKLSNIYPLSEFESMPAAYVKKPKSFTPFEGNNDGYYGATEYSGPSAPPVSEPDEIPF